MNSSSKIRVLLADHSSFVRRDLQELLQTDPLIEVVGEAQNGREAISAVRKLQPDLIVMDLNMPLMSGLDALKIIMREFPTPVIVLCGPSSEGAAQAMEALEIGAVDFVTRIIGTRSPEAAEVRAELMAKIRTSGSDRRLHARLRLKRGNVAARERENRERLERPPMDNTPQTAYPATGLAEKGTTILLRSRPEPAHFRIVVIGVSTGGPMALHSLIPCLPPDLPVPMLIVQHMPAHFTRSLAKRLDFLSHAAVREAEDGHFLRPGEILVAPGGRHLIVGRSGRTVKILDEPADSLHKPSVNVTVASATRQFGGRALGVIMTGMGHDGRDGMLELSRRGGYILAQDAASCVVYGMPKAVVEAGIANEIHPLGNLAEAIASCLGRHSMPPKHK